MDALSFEPPAASASIGETVCAPRSSIRTPVSSSAAADVAGVSEKQEAPRVCSVCSSLLERPEVRACAEPLRRGPRFCTRCRFRFMDPFRPAACDEDVLYIGSLPERGGLAFQLELPELRQLRKAGREFELRSVRAHRSEIDKDLMQQAWPARLFVNANGREVFVVKPGKRGHKRRDVPQDLSAYLRRGTNTMKLWAEDPDPADFVVAMVLVSCLKPKDVAATVTRLGKLECLDRVRALVSAPKRCRSSDDGADGKCRVAIGASVSCVVEDRPVEAVAPKALSDSASAVHGEEVECVGDERLPLRCPITLDRLAGLPARGSACTHLQCFDLDAYLVSNYRMRAFNNRWQCPICSLELRPSDLCIDGFVEEVLRDTLEALATEVMVAPDGSWQAREPSPPPPPSDDEPCKDDGKRPSGAIVPHDMSMDGFGGCDARVYAGAWTGLTPETPLASGHVGLGGKRMRGGTTASRKRVDASKPSHQNKVRRKPLNEPLAKSKARKRPPPAPLSNAGIAPRKLGKMSARARLALRAAIPPPKRAIGVDSDAEPDLVSDSSEEALRKQGGLNREIHSTSHRRSSLREKKKKKKKKPGTLFWIKTGAVLCVFTLCMCLGCEGFAPPIALRSGSAAAWKSPHIRTCKVEARRHPRIGGLRMAGEEKDGQQQDGPPPINFAMGFGDSSFMPADFLAMHEMVVAAQMGRGEAELEMANVGAAISDEIQRTYMLSVCAFAGAPDYCRSMSTKDESAALKYVRSETLKLPQEEAIMQIYPEQGKWMAQLVLAMGAKKVLEIGTFTGYSSTSMASVLPPGGRLICCDVNEDYVSTARKAWRKAGVADVIDLRMGPALDTLNGLLEAGEAGTFDAVFIDADKENSDDYYERALLLLRDGGVVMIDDSLWSGRVMKEEEHKDPESVALRELNLKMSEDPRIMSSLLPIADGVTFGVMMPEWANKRGARWGTTGQGSRASDPAAASWSNLGGRVIAVEGNVAAGKSALIDGLSELCGGERSDVLVQDEEPDAALLACYHQDPKAMGFAFQVYMLNKCQSALRSANQKRQGGKISIVDRSVWGNRAFAMANLRANYISPDQFKMYEGLVSGDSSSADLMVYLDVPPEICSSRCKARGRDVEGTFCEGFLGEVDTAFFEVVKDAAAQGFPPVLVLDWREYGSEEDAAALIAACLGGGVTLPKVSKAKEVPPDVAEGKDTVIDVASLKEMNSKRLRGEEFLISDFRAGPRTFLQVLSPMLAGGAAMGLNAGTAQSGLGGRLFVVEPSENMEGYQELSFVFRRAVLHGLSRLLDVVIVSHPTL